MNFFEQQDRARRNTTRLVALMGLAVACLIAITTALVGAVVYYFQFSGVNHVQAFDQNRSIFDIASQVLSWELLGSIALGVSALVVLAALFKLMQLSGGGRKVAESMGGRLINLNTRDSDEKKMLNVVEEMAIAAGTPVPPVYLMEDESINAFAAGYKIQDAVIGVTRGCIQHLSRDELQGVVAHEFSHIFHGDMRLNLRLVGILHGILIVGLAGHLLMRSGFYGSASRSRSSNNSSNTAAIFGIGVALIAIGYAGTFFGNLIKAAVSRQREFLADASAVQFTRNPDGISGALKKIGALPAGSKVSAKNASEFSHMYFSQGISSAFNSMMATHPPLAERIQRIEPHWNGEFPALSASTHAANSSHNSARDERTAGFSSAATAASTTSSAASDECVLDIIGNPGEAQLEVAKQILNCIPNNLKLAAHDSFSARAIIYGLLLDSQTAIAEKQQSSLKQRAHPQTFKEFQKIAALVQQLSPELRLPLLELSMPALKELSPSQYGVFKECLILMIRADDKVDLFEWSLYRILMNNLDDQPNRKFGRLKLQDCSRPCEILFGALAQAGSDDPNERQTAFDSAITITGLSQLQLQHESFKLGLLDWALERLQQLKPLQKPLLLKALAACINSDETITAAEAELFRAIADSLDCPVPALLKGQKLA